jgi:hypothetical protein
MHDCGVEEQMGCMSPESLERKNDPRVHNVFLYQVCGSLKFHTFDMEQLHYVPSYA